MYFVWIVGSRGPEAQLWQHEPIDGNGKPRSSTLFKIKLTEAEQMLSLDYLAMKYDKYTTSN